MQLSLFSEAATPTSLVPTDRARSEKKRAARVSSYLDDGPSVESAFFSRRLMSWLKARFLEGCEDREFVSDLLRSGHFVHEVEFHHPNGDVLSYAESQSNMTGESIIQGYVFGPSMDEPEFSVWLSMDGRSRSLTHKNARYLAHCGVPRETD